MRVFPRLCARFLGRGQAISLNGQARRSAAALRPRRGPHRSGLVARAGGLLAGRWAPADRGSASPRGAAAAASPPRVAAPYAAVSAAASSGC